MQNRTFAEAQVLQAIEIDYIDESEVLSPADDVYHINKESLMFHLSAVQKILAKHSDVSMKELL